MQLNSIPLPQRARCTWYICTKPPLVERKYTLYNTHLYTYLTILTCKKWP
uniref:Uncharacterized protein n=1 Tax=Arundo donax TaxID=35708 RepID=A0A0A9DMY3_ARUDO